MREKIRAYFTPEYEEGKGYRNSWIDSHIGMPAVSVLFIIVGGLVCLLGGGIFGASILLIGIAGLLVSIINLLTYNR